MFAWHQDLFHERTENIEIKIHNEIQIPNKLTKYMYKSLILAINKKKNKNWRMNANPNKSMIAYKTILKAKESCVTLVFWIIWTIVWIAIEYFKPKRMHEIQETSSNKLFANRFVCWMFQIHKKNIEQKIHQI